MAGSDRYLPLEQMEVHSEDLPVSEEYFPAAQTVQIEDPEVVEKEPGEQE